MHSITFVWDFNPFWCSNQTLSFLCIQLVEFDEQLPFDIFGVSHFGLNSMFELKFVQRQRWPIPPILHMLNYYNFKFPIPQRLLYNFCSFWFGLLNQVQAGSWSFDPVLAQFHNIRLLREIALSEYIYKNGFQLLQFNTDLLMHAEYPCWNSIALNVTVLIKFI